MECEDKELLSDKECTELLYFSIRCLFINWWRSVGVDEESEELWGWKEYLAWVKDNTLVWVFGLGNGLPMVGQDFLLLLGDDGSSLVGVSDFLS